MASSHSLKNAVVGFGNKNSVKIAGFFTCLVDQLAAGEKSVQVTCHLHDDVLRLSVFKGVPHENSNPIMACDEKTISIKESTIEGILEHSPACPMRHLTQADHANLKDSPLAARSVALAVAVLLESCDGKLLMTQRAEHMRSYPLAWVPPGGHVEPGETLVECGLRELHEETGLDFKAGDLTMSVLCMWESVYPLILPHGLPRSHHLAIYMCAKAPHTAEELQNMMKMDPDEVMASAWFTPETVQRLRQGENETLEVFLVDETEAAKVRCITRDLSDMFRGSVFWRSGQIYTGTQQALTHWSTSRGNPIVSKI